MPGINTFPAIKRLLFILCLLTIWSLTTYGQTGGARRERKVKSKGAKVLGGAKSKGHADEFARGNSGRRGRLSRLFRSDRPAWQYRKSGSKRTNYRDNKDLFTRQRSKGKIENDTYQERENRNRARHREHGNKVFKKKKYKKR